ncbi:MAG: DUF2490 domain-containing protein [Tatlockia sp.]|nr:DUF2490 domain-containing protein [Tatlockia sp.]
MKQRLLIMKLFIAPPWLILILFIVLPFQCFPDKQPLRVWTNIQYSSEFSKKTPWVYGLSLEGRFTEQPGLLYQTLMQAQLGYRSSNRTKIWLGYTYIPTRIVEPDRRIKNTVRRIYQQLEAELLKNLNLELSSRSRLEERRRTGYKELSLVYRQLVLISFPRFRVQSRFTPFISEEIFLNLNRPIWSNQKQISQNRFMFGFSFPCAKHRCQLAYLNQFLVNRVEHEINNVIYFSFII